MVNNCGNYILNFFLIIYYGNFYIWKTIYGGLVLAQCVSSAKFKWFLFTAISATTRFNPSLLMHSETWSPSPHCKYLFKGCKNNCVYYIIFRVLYGNKITHLQSRLFEGLTSLQLLLINANKIECIKADTFVSLNSLNLL